MKRQEQNYGQVKFKAVTEPAAWGATPNEAQLKYHNDELAAFCHFGMNTFTDKEWGDGKEDSFLFAPTGNVGEYAKSWVKALKDAGFNNENTVLCIAISSTRHEETIKVLSEFIN